MALSIIALLFYHQLCISDIAFSPPLKLLASVKYLYCDLCKVLARSDNGGGGGET